MLSQRIKYTSQEICKYQWYTSKLLCIDETGKYYESRNIKSEFQHKRWYNKCIKN